MQKIVEVLMERDSLSREEAEEQLEEVIEMMREALLEDGDPADVLAEELGFEPDYLDELWEKLL